MQKIKNKDVLLLTILFFIIQVIFSFKWYTNYINKIGPLLWIIFSVYLLYKNNKTYQRFSYNRYYIQKIILLSIFYFVLYFYLGFLIGFANNPYSQDPISILTNAFRILTPIIGVELIRGIIINTNKENFTIIIGITIILFLLETNLSYLFLIKENSEQLFKYVCSNLIPLLAGNILYTYLTKKGSFFLPLIYRICTQSIFLFLPIIPDINWFITGTIGLLTPFVIYLLFQYRWNKGKERIPKREKYKSKMGISITLLLTVNLTAFMLGLFAYEPVAMLSNSMSPLYQRGDVIIYKKEVELDKLEKGNIVLYKIENQIIAHRIIDIKKEEGKTVYLTKGDANNAPDIKSVTNEQIIGMYVFHIKYIGYPSVWLNEYFNKETSVVETK